MAIVQALGMIFGPLVNVPLFLYSLWMSKEWDEILPVELDFSPSLEALAATLAVYSLIGFISPRADVVEPLHGVAFGGLAFHYSKALLRSSRGMIYMVMIGAYALRYTFRAAKKLYRNPEADVYREMKAHYRGWWWLVRFFLVFLFRGLLVWGLTLPFFLGHLPRARMSGLEYGAVFLFTMGFYYAYIADSHLAEFRAYEKNDQKLCAHGVYRMCRHPGHFGDVISLIGLYTFSLGERSLTAKFPTAYPRYCNIVPGFWPQFG